VVSGFKTILRAIFETPYNSHVSGFKSLDTTLKATDSGYSDTIYRRANRFEAISCVVVSDLICKQSSSWTPPDTTNFITAPNKHFHGHQGGHLFNLTIFFSKATPTYSTFFTNNITCIIYRKDLRRF
jgi:hypothetical protein